MKADQIPLFTLRETPKDAQVVSHQLLLRAGFIKKQTSGFYVYLPFGWIVHRKIEQIVREEMDRYGGVEMHLPVMTHSNLWKGSGRWSTMGPELLQLKDRHQNEFCLAPTHEEAMTFLARSHLKSYKQLPINLYQIGLKYRDEIRPRYGLMRSREFVMKDAYSFHIDEECLDKTYQKMRECYRAIFLRCGIHTISVEADSGNMGGSASEEFMAVSEIGESTLLLVEDLTKSSFSANQEKTEFIPPKSYPILTAESTPKRVDTPNLFKVSEVSNYLNKPVNQFIKTLIYENDRSIVIAFIPGDRDASLTKLQSVSGEANLEMASSDVVERVSGAPAGFAGPYQLKISDRDIVKLSKEKQKKVHLYYDRNLCSRGSLISGGNKKDTHFIELCEGRDFKIPEGFRDIDIVLARAGDLCPKDKSQRLVETKGIELGHIFKLGRKYSRLLELNILDKDGRNAAPYMGSYGIGIGRTLQTYVEQNHDDKGIIWSKVLAPFEIYLIAIFNQEEELRKQEKVYFTLQEEGFSVYFDNRKERAGVKFNDADLTGFPWQVVAGKKFVENETLELIHRRTNKRKEYSLGALIKRLKDQ